MKSLGKYKNSSKSLSSGLGPLRKSVTDLKSSQVALKEATRSVFNELKSDLANSFGGSLIRRLQVMFICPVLSAEQ
jgi:hypothetical protein